MKRLQITSGSKCEKGVKHQKIFNAELRILLNKIYLVDWELKRPKEISLYHLEKDSKFDFIGLKWNKIFKDRPRQCRKFEKTVDEKWRYFFWTLYQTKFWRGANGFDERYFSYFLHFHIGPHCKHGDSKVVFLSFMWKLL